MLFLVDLPFVLYLYIYRSACTAINDADIAQVDANSVIHEPYNYQYIFMSHISVWFLMHIHEPSFQCIFIRYIFNTYNHGPGCRMSMYS